MWTAHLYLTAAEQVPLILETTRELCARRKRPVNVRAARTCP